MKNITFQRIEKLKKQYEKYSPTLNFDLALVKTQVMKETEGQPMVIRRAKAFKKYCETKPINILDDELIVGNTGKAPREAVVTPEVSVNWISEELDTVATRPYDPIAISDEDKKLFREEIEPYWTGKTVLDQWLTRIPEDVVDLGYKSGVIDAEIKTQTGPGEFSPGYADILLPKGYGGIKAEAEEHLAKLSMTVPDEIPKIEFLKGVIITCEAMDILAKRHAQKATELADMEKNETRKKELLEIAEVCTWVGSNPPRTFREALQLIWFTQVGLFLELSAPSYSPGRFDQYMYPYYKADIDAGRTTKEEAQEVLECTWVKMAEQLWYLSENASKYYAGYTAFQNTGVGGITPDGKDAVNEMSYMVLQASYDVRLCQPSLSVRLNKKNPEEFFKAVAELAAIGTGFPAIHNDEVGIQNLLKKGVTQEEANNWCLVGCVEPNLSGKMHQWSVSTAFNYGSAIEFVMTNGVHRMSGEKLSIETGDFYKMTTFDEFYEAFKKQVAYLIEISSVYSNITEIAQKELCPCPLSSMLLEGCVETATDIMDGGTKYNIGPGTQGIGVADAANSLAAMQKLVFEEKKISKEELQKALDANFEGYERIQQMLINGAPKYGNDDDYSDHFAKEIAEFTVSEHHKYKTLRGDYLMPSLYPVSSNIPQGESVGALPSGRKEGLPLADGCSPTHGTEELGPTAVLKSVGKIDGAEVDGGMLLNIKFDPSAISGEDGLERFVSYIKSFMDLGLYHIQFNVIDRETLEDARANPQDYKTLLVRVSGYSAYFVEISKPLQDDLIGRTAFKAI